ncbi:hypothetical protein DIE14_11165 [Burkholderia sp. Bp9017]|nr:hypothetical protein DIE14_11165 [Burkholderia sp. Bp9017]
MAGLRVGKTWRARARTQARRSMASSWYAFLRERFACEHRALLASMPDATDTAAMHASQSGTGTKKRRIAEPFRIRLSAAR